MDHLYELDYLREGIHLRSYAQKDPLVEYKQEAFTLFSDMLDEIDRSILWGLFHARFDFEEKGRRKTPGSEVAVHQVVSAYGAAEAPSAPATVQAQAQPRGPAPPPRKSVVHAGPKVGRNDPCPCGSGKKYKKCCGKDVR
jgi:preprotein translocase subunit SecA